MELLLLIPLAAAAAGLYWIFKPPYAAEIRYDDLETAFGLPSEADKDSGAVATVHAAPIPSKKSTGE